MGLVARFRPTSRPSHWSTMLLNRAPVAPIGRIGLRWAEFVKVCALEIESIFNRSLAWQEVTVFIGMRGWHPVNFDFHWWQGSAEPVFVSAVSALDFSQLSSVLHLIRINGRIEAAGLSNWLKSFSTSLRVRPHDACITVYPEHRSVSLTASPWARPMLLFHTWRSHYLKPNKIAFGIHIRYDALFLTVNLSVRYGVKTGFRCPPNTNWAHPLLGFSATLM